MLLAEQDQLVAVVHLAGVHVLVGRHGAVLVVDGGTQLAMLVGEVVQDVGGFPQVRQVDDFGQGHIIGVNLGSGDG